MASISAPGAAALARAAVPAAGDSATAASLLGKGDLTLRAGGDGATVRVHRGIVAAYSRVLEDVLASTKGDELPLPGKTKADLELLVSWFYRVETFTVVRCGPLLCCDAEC